MGGDDGATGRRGRWIVPSANESGVLACSLLQGPPALKPTLGPQPASRLSTALLHQLSLHQRLWRSLNSGELRVQTFLGAKQVV